MLRSRRFEEAVAELWQQGLVAGEMHLGYGEEGIVAGVLSCLSEGDALALDHRGTPPLVMRGVSLDALLAEMLGREDGLCRGRGGHMHLFSRDHLAASSGIVGSAGPMATGFAITLAQIDPGKVAVAFFGDGAMNQGMLLESMNLAVAWKLPVLFVCKDSGWAITTHAPTSTGGDLTRRAKSFGMAAREVDGASAEAVEQAARMLVQRARDGRGPGFLRAHCIHSEGHFLGDPLIRALRHPKHELGEIGPPLLAAARQRGGGSLRQRLAGAKVITATLTRFAMDHGTQRADPLSRLRRKLLGDKARLSTVEREVDDEIRAVLGRVVS